MLIREQPKEIFSLGCFVLYICKDLIQRSMKKCVVFLFAVTSLVSCNKKTENSISNIEKKSEDSTSYFESIDLILYIGQATIHRPMGSGVMKDSTFVDTFYVHKTDDSIQFKCNTLLSIYPKQSLSFKQSSVGDYFVGPSRSDFCQINNMPSDSLVVFKSRYYLEESSRYYSLSYEFAGIISK
jgi:hypothetical protein